MRSTAGDEWAKLTVAARASDPYHAATNRRLRVPRNSPFLTRDAHRA
jgi:hypothetical protein